MDMVVFAVEFEQFSLKVLANIGENLLKIGQQGFSEYKSTIFGHKDQMHMQIEHAVSTASNVSGSFHRPTV